MFSKYPNQLRTISFLLPISRPHLNKSYAIQTFSTIRFSSTKSDPNSQKPQCKQNFETHSNSATPAKPKSNTTLRKAALASLPIRETPTPTRGAIRPVFTYTRAEGYQLSSLKSALKGQHAVMLAEALWVPSLRGGQVDESSPETAFGEAFIFENGCAVFWGIEEDDARRFLNKLSKRTIEIGRYTEEETEEIEFVTDPAERTRLQGDLIILGESKPLSAPEEVLPSSLPTPALPEATLPARYAFSDALARSTALAAIETGVEEFLSSASKLPHTLAATGKPGLTRTEIIKKMGLLLRFRQRIFLNPQNFTDMPEIYWSEPDLEKYFMEMSDALEIKSRTQIVNAKITYAVELQSVMRELLTEASGHRMELIIIALIAFEATLAFIREGPEIWRMITGKPSPQRERH